MEDTSLLILYTMTDCVWCGGRQFQKLKELDELTDEEWAEQFPTFAGQRAVVKKSCTGCQ